MTDAPRLDVLREILARPDPRRPGESCELCSRPVPDEHQHVVHIEDRGLLCACRACWLLFTQQGAAEGRYRAVPDRWLSCGELELSDPQWDRLQIPVSMAFFFQNSQIDQTVAFYPSPAGATESLLPLDAWDDLIGGNPGVPELEPDVEALLIRRERSSFEAYVVPIDACYELVGHLRQLWKGFDGGAEARDKLDEFFESAAARSRPVPA